MSHIHSSQSEKHLTEQDVVSLYKLRQEQLQSIRGVISPKFFHAIEEKLLTEKNTFERLLHIEEEKRESLSHYSFVLHPHYFEQKFLGNEE